MGFRVREVGCVGGVNLPAGDCCQLHANICSRVAHGSTLKERHVPCEQKDEPHDVTKPQQVPNRTSWQVYLKRKTHLSPRLPPKAVFESASQVQHEGHAQRGAGAREHVADDMTIEP